MEKKKCVYVAFDGRGARRKKIKLPLFCFRVGLAAVLAIVLVLTVSLYRLFQYQYSDAATETRLKKLQIEYKDLQLQLAEKQSALDQQTDNYQKELDSFSQKALDLQQALDELSKDKETILNELHRISFLPPLAEEVASSAPIQPLAMSVSTPAESSLDTNLEAQFTYLSDLLDVQQAAFSQLTSEIQDMKPIISNYPTIWPVKGRLTSPFGYRQNPLGSGSEFHSGLDIAVPTGTEIVATGGGSVTFAGSQGGYGNLVIIQHGMGLETYYGHNSKLLVKTGDTVVRGQIIARSGNTGSSTGPHLHYEVKKDGTAVNPEQYLP